MRVSRCPSQIIARDPPLRDTRKGDDRAHIPCTRNQYASRSIRIIYFFVTLLLELSSANHTDVLSRTAAAFLSPNVLGIRVLHQCARIACVSGEICGLIICSQYTCFRIERNSTYQVLIICAYILPNASVIVYKLRLSPALNKSSIRLNNKI